MSQPLAPAGGGREQGGGTRAVQPKVRHAIFFDIGDQGFQEALGAVPDLEGAAAVLAAGDYDADGQVDVFVGSHGVPGTDEASESRLLRNEDGVFRDVTAEAAPMLADLRTVTDACWADVDADGFLDLLVVGEWMPITLLRNDGGRFRDATVEAGLGN